MAPRRPADDHDSVEASSNKRPRIEDEGVARLHLRGGSGETPSNPANPPSVLQKPPVPVAFLGSSVPNTPSQQTADQPSTPPNQTDASASLQGPQQPPPRTNRVLAAARTSTQCTLKVGTDANGQPILENVVLLLKLQVHTCSIPFETRLGYLAGIILRREGPQGPYDQHIGEVRGWRVSKTSRTQLNVDDRYFVQELLKTPLDQFEKDSTWTELASALRVMYTNNGEPRVSVNPLMRPTLDFYGSDLVFIQMLHIKLSDDDGTVFQGNGFGRLALDMFYRLLSSRLLPAWYAVKTPATFLLVPAIPEGEKGRRWDESRPPGEDDNAFYDRVEATLANMYNRWGYDIYRRRAQLVRADKGEAPYKVILTVMGRTFDKPVPSDPNDRIRRVKDRTAQDAPQFSSPADSPMRQRQLPPSESTDENDFSQLLGQVATTGASTGTGIPGPAPLGSVP